VSDGAQYADTTLQELRVPAVKRRDNLYSSYPFGLRRLLMKATVPSDLLKLKAQFEHWRKTRSTRSRIPVDLRAAAIALLDRYLAAAICRACRLHPHTLKPSTGSKPRLRNPTTTTAQAFFPLPADAMLRILAAVRRDTKKNLRLGLG